MFHKLSLSLSLLPSSPSSGHMDSDSLGYEYGLPMKTGALSSSHGSMLTVTTMADEDETGEEVGRVAGWIASFDKLLGDPLGVACLQVSWCAVCGERGLSVREVGREGGREREGGLYLWLKG